MCDLGLVGPLDPFEMVACRTPVNALGGSGRVHAEAGGEQKRALADRAAGPNRDAGAMEIRPVARLMPR
jgi:hypothetical protein